MTGTAQGSYKLGPTPPSADNSTRHATTAFLASYGIRVDIAQAFSLSQQVQAQSNLGIGPRWSQVYAAIEAQTAGGMRSVAAAVKADPSDPVNIEFAHGSFAVSGGPLANLIQSTLGYTAAQMTALFTAAAGYPTSGAQVPAAAISPASVADARAASRTDVWMSPAQTAAEVLALLVPANVAASGTTQSGATALTALTNVVTSAASGSGVILSSIGRQEVMSAGANAVAVYPASGAQIYVNGSLLAVNAAMSLSPGNHATFLTIVPASGVTTHYGAP